MKRILIPVLLLISISGIAQNFTVSGYISDKNTGEKLLGAGIYNPESEDGTTSNEYGFYSITLAAGNVHIIFSFVGYTNRAIDFRLNGDTVIHVLLESNTLLNEVVVEAEKSEEEIQNRTQMSTIDIPVEQIKSLPAFLGEVDILKTLQLLPGVQGGTEGTSGLFVRGGSPDQNLMLLDGVPVYNASHLFGFFSVFNADAVNKVTLIKGGFPARYGGRLSSVVDIRMKEGNMQEFHGEGSIGLVASRFTVEGPIKKDTSSFIISARRTYIDLITRPIVRLQTNGTSYGGYYFYDLNAKVNYKFTDKDRLYLSGYFGRDRFYFGDEHDFGEDYSNYYGGLTWGNATAVIRWNHLISKKLFSNLTGTFSSYNFDIYNDIEQQEDGIYSYAALKYFSGIRDFSLREDFDFIPVPEHYIKFGGSVINHTFRPGATEFQLDNSTIDPDDILLAADNINAVEADIFAEDDWEISPVFKCNIGVHGSAFFVGDRSYTSLQPRITSRWLLNEKLSLKFSFATMTQYIHLLSNAGIGLPTDLWVPSTELIAPENSWQPAAGIAYTWKNDFETSAEFYYKHMNGIIEYKEGASYLNDGSTDWENKVESGEANAWGMELFVQKKIGQFSGWLGYTLSWSNRQFETINLGEVFPYKYDRRHDFEVAAIYKLNDHIEASATWQYGSGQAISIPIAKYPGFYGQDIYFYEGRNGYRMPSYHRLDCSISFKKQKKYWEQTWVFSVYNVYSRKNPFFIYLGEDDFTHDQVYKMVSLFPVIPSVAYNFKF